MSPYWHIRIADRSLRRPQEVYGRVADIEQSVLDVGSVRGEVNACHVCVGGNHAESCALACRNRDAESCLWGAAEKRGDGKNRMPVALQ